MMNDDMMVMTMTAPFCTYRSELFHFTATCPQPGGRLQRGVTLEAISHFTATCPQPGGRLQRVATLGACTYGVAGLALIASRTAMRTVPQTVANLSWFQTSTSGVQAKVEPMKPEARCSKW
jgi:hypothetical protein